MIDTYKADIYGGTGQAFDWELLKKLERKEFAKGKIILSGGIGVENIEKALAQKIFAIDVNSKVEKYPGKKDEVLLKQLFEIRRLMYAD